MENTEPQSSATIFLLDERLRSQIAAGEVIERPASVVKELLENSMDAGATEITLEVFAGGADRIVIKDNGRGMSRVDLEKAAVAHATSKIRNFEDLTRVHTFGFRGEALSSVASVGRLSISSVLPGETMGWRWERRHPDQEATVAPVTHAPGTIVEVEDLFFNVPARRRFLRAAATEWGHILTWVVRLALARTDVGFKIFKDGHRFLTLTAGTPLSERLRELGIGDGGAFYEISSPHEEHTVEAVLQSPVRSSSKASELFLYVNRRFVQDRLVKSAVVAGLRGTLEVGRTPVGVINLTVPEHLVDVNVHPAKTEVRFLHGSRVYQWLEHSLAQWSARREWVTQESRVMLQNVGIDARPDGLPKREPITADSASSWESHAGIPWVQLSRSIGEMAVQPVASRIAASTTEAMKAPSQVISQNAQPALFSENFQVLGQWHAKYILVSEGDQLWLLDQHAVHERVRYERLKEQAGKGNKIDSQLFLIPEALDLPVDQVEHVRSALELFSNLGWQLSLRERSIEVLGCPADVPTERSLEVLRELVRTLETADLGTAVQTRRWDDVRHLLWATQACKGAIKAGDWLPPAQLKALCDDARRVGETAHCPHGRPSWVRLALSDADHLFHR